MSRVISLIFLAAFCLHAAPARADDAGEFMSRFSGEWLGSGQLLVGAENGLKFSCELDGDPSRTRLTFGMKGRCWMGALSAPVNATLRYNAETNRFYGAFMDGAQGNGLDIVGARAGDDFSLQLARGPAQGRLVAETVNPDQMKITIYYRDRARNRELPVAAMGFTRKSAGAIGLPDYMSDVVTGSVKAN
jgi:hypothetical protein